ncbi:hypothetical protein F443_07210 [Phytophthora nicotianae P1569]|uniref:SWIM-type domain-containing protein n=1 Tax=Phytophthora nicotianae P1569 TaxID=1317065 RepID=V9FBJ6_PHYNI|nr:hypothetical protein F443_07210 [Phytophthora nicotianae P1569]
MRDIADLHFTATAGAYSEKKAKLLSDWKGDTRLTAFTVTSRSSGWAAGFIAGKCSTLDQAFPRLIIPSSSRSRLAFLLNDAPSTSEDHVYVASELCDRVYAPQARRTSESLPVTSRLSVQTARAEVRGTPGEGWRVDVLCRCCPCDYYLKLGVCTHLVFALYVRGLLDLSKRKKLAYRGSNNALRAQSERQPAGRPIGNSTALNKE